MNHQIVGIDSPSAPQVRRTGKSVYKQQSIIVRTSRDLSLQNNVDYDKYT